MPESYHDVEFVHSIFPRERLRLKSSGDEKDRAHNPNVIPRNVFVTGGTGYIGRRLIPFLLAHGHTVRALVRRGSEVKLPEDWQPAPGDALDKATFSARIAPRVNRFCGQAD